jgi:hypothetical protein
MARTFSHFRNRKPGAVAVATTPWSGYFYGRSCPPPLGVSSSVSHCLAAPVDWRSYAIVRPFGAA